MDDDQHDSHVIVWKLFSRHGVHLTIVGPPPLDAKQFAMMVNGQCPDCSGILWRQGPRGGLSKNIECVGCKSRFNVARWQGEFVMAERIENHGEWREDMFPKVLE